MNKPKDDLHRLIQLMTQAEKRYFKMHFALKQNVLTDLYEIINKMQVYDEEFVKKHLNENAAKNLKVHKVQLMDLLLRSLASYHQKRTPASRIRQGLEEVDLLITKQLHDAAFDRLQKIKQFCLEYEEFTYLLEIAYKEYQMQYIWIDKIGISNFHAFSQIGEYLDKLVHQNELSIFNIKMLDIIREHDYDVNSAEMKRLVYERMQDPVLQNDKETLRAKLIKNMFYAQAYDVLKDKELEHFYRKSNLDLVEQHKAFREVSPFGYLAVLRNYANFCEENEHWDLLSATIQRAKDFTAKYPAWNIQLINFYQSEVHMHFNLHNFEYLHRVIEPEVAVLVEYYHLSGQRIVQIINLHFALLNIVLGQPAVAQKYLWQLHEAADDIKAYFEEIYKIVEIINHFESGDYFLVSNIVNAIRRKKGNQASHFYDACLQWFKKLSARPADQSRLAQELLAQLPKFEKEKVLNLFNYFQLQGWLQAKASGIPFVQKKMKA